MFGLCTRNFFGCDHAKQAHAEVHHGKPTRKHDKRLMGLFFKHDYADFPRTDRGAQDVGTAEGTQNTLGCGVCAGDEGRLHPV